MAVVTVTGAGGSTVALTFNSAANATLAGQLAALINQGVAGGSVIAADDTGGRPPAVAAGKTGEFVQTRSGLTTLPTGYADVVSVAPNATLYSSTANGQAVLAGDANKLTFNVTGGSGTIVGGASDKIVIPGNVAGDWVVQLGAGDDTVLATGSGHETVAAGAGHNRITLGSGEYQVRLGGDDTVTAGSGAETVDASAANSTLIYGGSGSLDFIGGAGGATIFGGTGSETVQGGSGTNVFHGGAAGNNVLFAGTGQATLFGGGSGDKLYAQGDQAQTLVAGPGNATLSGALSTGDDVFQFTKAAAARIDVIEGFAATDKVALQGYGAGEAAGALASAVIVGGATTITLSDQTTITFQNFTGLKSGNFG